MFKIPDYVFFSNIRRFKQAPKDKGCVIATSNIDEKVDYKIPYKKYLNRQSGVEDNAALMLIKILIDCGVKKIYIAGMDGYSNDIHANYINEDLQIAIRSESVVEKNEGLSKVLRQMNLECDLEFVTSNKNISLK